MVTNQLQVRCRPVKVRRSETNVLPLSHPTNLGLPLGLTSSTTNSIHFFTHSLSSFLNTWPYHLNLLRCNTITTSSNANLSRNVSMYKAKESQSFQFPWPMVVCYQGPVTKSKRSDGMFDVDYWKAKLHQISQIWSFASAMTYQQPNKNVVLIVSYTRILKKI